MSESTLNPGQLSISVRYQDINQESYAFQADCHGPILKTVSNGGKVYTLQNDGTVNVIDIERREMQQVIRR